MKHLFTWVLLMASLAFVACGNETKETTTATDSSGMSAEAGNHSDSLAPMPMVNHAEAAIAATNPDTAVTGTAKFEASEGKVKMELELSVPSRAGKAIAVHIHEHGDCGDMGNMAHGHWNPGNTQHGKWGSGSFHAGDIGNVQLDAKGNGKIELETDLWTLGGTPDKNILDRAIIVHAGPDDYTTQPTGNSGARIGCGVIK